MVEEETAPAEPRGGEQRRSLSDLVQLQLFYC